MVDEEIMKTYSSILHTWRKQTQGWLYAVIVTLFEKPLFWFGVCMLILAVLVGR